MLITILQAVLGAFFIFTGTTIISGKMANEFKKLGLPSLFNFLTGFIEIVGAIGMIAGYWFPISALLAGLLLGTTMLVAAFMLIVVARDPFKKAIPAMLLSLLSYIIAIYML
ncbi:DoxX family protein [Paenibacillus albus]|uniref:DoxX family membrane protein n=1 Tax=Paenibacillus albus TaxID=2495582 RepID=A0A3S9A7N5_9BACL|nr:DoxX family protein [Paenibacillus albus]AZN41755.1 DoxX family membrane protein [Paenibacillus albus]